MRHGVIAKTSNLTLSLRDQPLQQVDTIMAELQDKITQSKRNTILLNAQENETQSAL